MPGKKPNSRLSFEQLPADVRAFVERILGSPVTSARSQAGGFSPGTADRLVGENGVRVFVKAVSRELNEGSFKLFRAEVAVWEALAGLTLPAPALRGHAEFGDWIALAFDDVDGHEPEADEADVRSVLATLAQLPAAPAGLELPEGLQRTVRAEVEQWQPGWDAALAGGALDVLPGYAVEHGDEIAELVAGAADAADGDTLQHVDVHPDNVIVDDSGAVWLVDWPWVAVGASWFDSLEYLASLLTEVPTQTVQRWAALPESALALASDHDVDAVLAALSASLLNVSLLPPPPAIVGLREGQRTLALASLDWLAHRRGW